MTLRACLCLSLLSLIIAACASLPVIAPVAPAPPPAIPVAASIPPPPKPAARWGFHPEAAYWSRASRAALQDHAAPLVAFVPRDIDAWCPAYPEADDRDRRSFWVGLISALAKYESTWKPEAVGGRGGKWFGLVQIAPATARGYGCRSTSREHLKDGGDNLSCGLRIMAVTVPRDGVIEGRDHKWRGVAADWTPMRKPHMVADMKEWTNEQKYCRIE